MKRRRRVLWMQSWNIVLVVGKLLHIKTLENKCKQCDIHITRGKELNDKRPNWCVLHNDTLNPAGAFCCCCSGWRKQPHTPGTNTLRSWTGLLLMTLLDKNQQGRKKPMASFNSSQKMPGVNWQQRKPYRDENTTAQLPVLMPYWRNSSSPGLMSHCCTQGCQSFVQALAKCQVPGLRYSLLRCI